MRIRTLLLTMTLMIAFVFLGVYLSESATNQLRGLGRSPQLISLSPWDEGGYCVQILGTKWIIDPAALRERTVVLVMRMRDFISQQIEDIMAR